MNYYNKYDEIIKNYQSITKYAKMMFASIIEKESLSLKKVFTTNAYGLGIASPSLIDHIVVGGLKRGRIIKHIPEDKDFCVFTYDDEGNIITLRKGSHGKLSNEVFIFFETGGFKWVVDFYEDGSVAKYADIYRIKYKDDKIESYYTISDANLIGEEYSYIGNNQIICDRFFYSPQKIGSSKEINIGYEGSPMSRDVYQITGDKIVGYSQQADQLVLLKEWSLKKKKAPRVYKQIENWLDSTADLLDSSPDNGLYFELHEGNDNFFTIILFSTVGFGYNEWACDVVAEISTYDVRTNQEYDWEKILTESKKYITKYMKNGTEKDVFLKSAGIGLGFPDGDLIIISA